VTQKPSKKRAILRVAAEHFSRYGYDATHLEAIAKECGISKPAIYYHFKDKAALYETILFGRFSTLSRLIEESTQSEDPVENLKHYIRTFGTFLTDMPCFSAIFAREIADGARAMPESCIVELSGTLQRLAIILQQGREKKVFECENPFMIQMMIVTTLSSYITTEELRKRVSHALEGPHETIDPNIEDMMENLTQKITKALLC